MWKDIISESHHPLPFKQSHPPFRNEVFTVAAPGILPQEGQPEAYVLSGWPMIGKGWDRGLC